MRINTASSVKYAASMAAALAITGAATAAPTVDGKFDASEGYSNGHYINFAISGGSSTLPEKGQLWTSQDANGDVYYAAIFSKGLVDNSYGANSIGWGSKGHTFDNLVGSDQGTFNIKNGAGASVFSFKQDYISQIKGPKGSPAQYASAGVTGGDGGVLTGQAAWFLDGATSLEYNLNNVSMLTVDSPFANQDYSNPSNPNWIYEVIYEGKISHEAFGASGYGDLALTVAHVSPPKVQNVIPVIDGPIPVVPEPGTMALVAAGILPIAGGIIRRRRA